MKVETKETIKRVAWKTVEIFAEAGLVISAAMLGAEVAGAKVRDSISEAINDLKEEV